MTDLEKKAREYAEQSTTAKTWGIHKRALTDAFLAGAAYALDNQWRDADTDLPEWNKDVVVACQIPNNPEIEYSVGYHNREWYLEHEYLDAFGRPLAWMEIPEYKPKGE